MVVTNAGDDRLVGRRIAFCCFRGGFEQSRHMLGFLVILDLCMCLLGGRAFSFNTRASGRANDCQAVAFELIADNVDDLIREFANGGAAVFLHHPVLLPLRGAAF